MQNFTFHNPTKIIFGEGQNAAIDAEVPRDARVLITSGGGSITRNGVLAQVEAALGHRLDQVARHSPLVWSRIEDRHTLAVLENGRADHHSQPGEELFTFRGSHR